MRIDLDAGLQHRRIAVVGDGYARRQWDQHDYDHEPERLQFGDDAYCDWLAQWRDGGVLSKSCDSSGKRQRAFDFDADGFINCDYGDGDGDHYRDVGLDRAFHHN
jgi:hypothetical protein